MKIQLKFMGFSKSNSKREVYSNTILPQKTREPSINNLTLHLKKLEKYFLQIFWYKERNHSISTERNEKDYSKDQ